MMITYILISFSLFSSGNGCPDVFGSIAAFAGGGSVGSLGASELAGSGALITTVVVSMVWFASTRKVVLESVNLARDTIWYVFSLCYVLVAMHDGIITIWEALGCVFMYALYVLVVILSSTYVNAKPRGSALEAVPLTNTNMIGEGQF